MYRLRRSPLRVTAFAALAMFAVAGCAPKDKSEIKVAEIGDTVITLDYFERKMNTMDPQYAPENLDSREGREELLEIIVDKEVMALKAVELGMDADGSATTQADQVAEYKAITRMREDVVAPAQRVSEDEVYDYYENFARKLRVSYMLFDRTDQALEARGLVEGGEQWTKVAERFEAGDPGPSGDWTLEMKYGTVVDELEEAVFSLPVGSVSEPIESIYGYFLVRVEGQTLERLAPLDTMRDRIVASIQKQKSERLIADFRNEVFAQYDMVIDEGVLQIVFDALPPDPDLANPPAPEDLDSLDLEPADLNKVLLSYSGEVWDLRRYSDFYDGSSVFGRPRRQARIGGLRRALKEIAIRDLMVLAARDRGYMGDPVVQDEFKLRREQAMVTKLHEELIKGQVKISPEEVESYWAEHAEDFNKPEIRTVLALVAENETNALAAQMEAQAGVDWPTLIEKYNVDEPLAVRKGDLGEMNEHRQGVYAEHAFRAGEAGSVTYPAEVGEGQWLVLKIVDVKPREERSFEEAKIEVGRRLQGRAEEELFLQRVKEWREDYPIKTYPDELMKATYTPVGPAQSIPVTSGASR